METSEDLNGLYQGAQSQEEFHKVWELGLKKEAELIGLGWLTHERAMIILPGFWARYYELLKFGGTPEKIADLCQRVGYYFRSFNREAVELVINYGYLLSAIISQLSGDHATAGIINKELVQLASSSGSVPLALKVAGSLGLEKMKRGEFEKAIRIFSSAKEDFPEASNLPEAWQHLANIINQQGLSKLNLSDQKEGRVEKLNLISSAIVDLRDAEDLYMRVVPPPLKHLSGIQNRLITAAIKLLLNERTDRTVEAAHKIQEAFSAGDKAKAIQLILELRAIDVKSWDNIEGEVPGSAYAFVESIKLGLRLPEELLREV